MPEITVRAYEELNDHLPAARRKRSFRLACASGERVADAIRRLGIPTGEVEIALVDGESVGLEHRLEPGSRLSLYPMFEAFEVSAELRLREAPLRRPRFLVEPSLAELASLIEAVGLEVVCEDAMTDGELLRRAGDEDRILITTRRDLVREGGVSRAIVVSSGAPEDQVDEVLRRLDLESRLSTGRPRRRVSGRRARPEGRSQGRRGGGSSSRSSASSTAASRS